MEDLTIEQLIEMGQKYYPQLSSDQLMAKFEEVKAQLPPDMTNLEIAQVIFVSIKDKGEEEQSVPQRFSQLKGMIK